MGDTETRSRPRHVSKASQSSKDDSSSSSTSDSSDLPMPTPPDGGWGWVVVAAAFVINLIADGVAFSFGVLFVELHEYFQDSHSKLSWIGSVFFAMPLLAGPIASAMINKYGCRWTCIAGGIISTIGCVLSVFATSSEYLCMTFGIVSGIGLSFVYTPAVVIVAFYFEKKRAFATGLSVSGSGIGTFAIAPLVEYLIKTYGWRGTILMIGGLFLNIVVCGALLRPLETPGQRKRRKLLQSLERLSRESRNNSQQNLSANDGMVNHIEMHFDGRRCSASLVKLKKSLYEPVTHSLVQFPTYFYQDDKISPEGSVSEACMLEKAKVTFGNTCTQNDTGITKILTSSGTVPTIHVEDLTENGDLRENDSGIRKIQNNGIVPSICIESVTENGDLREKPAHIENGGVCMNARSSVKNGTIQKQGLGTSKVVDGTDVDLKVTVNDSSASAANGTILPGTSSIQHNVSEVQHSTLPKNDRHRKHSERFLPMYRRDIFYRGSLVRLDEFILNKSSSCPQLYRSDDTNDDETDGKNVTCCQWKHAKHVIKEMLDISIFKSVKYIVFFISNFILYTWYDVPYFYMPDYSTHHVGLSEEKASLAVAVIGIANMVGQIVFGIMADSPKVNCSLVYGVSMVICGASNLFYPLCLNFATICLNSAVFGFFIGANYSLCSIIIVEVLSLDKLTNAYGIMMCGQGVANLVGPPFAGFFYDLTGSYLTTFLLAGGFIIFSGTLLFIVAVIQFRSRKKQLGHQKESHGSAASIGDDGVHMSLMGSRSSAVGESASDPEAVT